jgi:hypothetical protein
VLIRKQSRRARGSVCYFFFKEGGETDQRSMVNGFCALIHQLFNQVPSLIKHATPAFSANGKKMVTIFDSLWDIFMVATADEECGPTVCVRDGLDEIEPSEYGRLITKLMHLYCGPGK